MAKLEDRVIHLGFRLDDPSAASKQEVEGNIHASKSRHSPHEAVRQAALDVAPDEGFHDDAKMGAGCHPCEFAGVPDARPVFLP